MVNPISRPANKLENNGMLTDEQMADVLVRALTDPKGNPVTSATWDKIRDEMEVKMEQLHREGKNVRPLEMAIRAVNGLMEFNPWDKDLDFCPNEDRD